MKSLDLLKIIYIYLPFLFVEDESCYLPYESYERLQKKKESEESSPSTPTSLFDRTEMVTHKTWDINNIQEYALSFINNLRSSNIYMLIRHV